MGLVLLSGCSGAFVGGPQPLTPEQRVRFETGYGAHEVMRPVVIEPNVDLSYFDDRDMAADALGRIGVESVPELRQALQSPEAAVRRSAARALAQVGPPAAPAVPELTRLLDDEDFEVRRMAARALGQIGPEARAAVPALLRVIGDHPGTSPPGADSPADARPALAAPRLDAPATAPPQSPPAKLDPRGDDTSVARRRPHARLV